MEDKLATHLAHLLFVYHHETGHIGRVEDCIGYHCSAARRVLRERQKEEA